MSRRSSEAIEGKRRSNGLAKFSGDWKGFVDLPLTDAQKEHISRLEGDDLPDFSAFLVSVLADGYKFSAVMDEKHHCCIATLTGKSAGCLNSGFSLSARGPDFLSALLVLHFKHVVICEEQVWSGHGSVNENQLSLWG